MYSITNTYRMFKLYIIHSVVQFLGQKSYITIIYHKLYKIKKISEEF